MLSPAPAETEGEHRTGQDKTGWNYRAGQDRTEQRRAVSQSVSLSVCGRVYNSASARET